MLALRDLRSFAKDLLSSAKRLDADVQQGQHGSYGSMTTTKVLRTRKYDSHTQTRAKVIALVMLAVLRMIEHEVMSSAIGIECGTEHDAQWSLTAVQDNINVSYNRWAQQCAQQSPTACAIHTYVKIV